MLNLKVSSYLDFKNISEISDIEKEIYSKMKYGYVKGINYYADKLTQIITNNYSKDDELLISGSAFGQVETAANQIVRIVFKNLEYLGYNITKIKFLRIGDFSIDNYAHMSKEDREESMKNRKIELESCVDIKNKKLIVIDDIKITGNHQSKVELYLKEKNIECVDFLYIFNFIGDNLDPSNEAKLNEFFVKNEIGNIINFMYEDGYRLNGRVLKMLLKSNKLSNYLEKIPKNILKLVYLLSKYDGGYDNDINYSKGYLELETYLKENNYIENKIIQYNGIIDSNGNLSIDGEYKNTLLNLYSKFKFGDIDAVKFFSKKLSEFFIDKVKYDQYFKTLFKNIGKDENIYIICPGIRNVASPSNLLMHYFAKYTNPFLSKSGYKTLVVKTLNKTNYTAENYAELSEKERIENKSKTERTFIPTEEFIRNNGHVIFIDDVEITGVSYSRTRDTCINAGVKSFTSIFIFKILNEKGEKEGKLENYINTYTIKNEIDNNVIKLINNKDFIPVQRLLRLIFSNNSDNFKNILYNNTINSSSLVEMYYSVISNDFLYVRDGIYKNNLLILEEYLSKNNLI